MLIQSLISHEIPPGGAAMTALLSPTPASSPLLVLIVFACVRRR